MSPRPAEGRPGRGSGAGGSGGRGGEGGGARRGRRGGEAGGARGVGGRGGGARVGGRSDQAGGASRTVRGGGVGGEQVEGRQAVRELLAARRRPVREVWMVEGLDVAPILDDIEQLATAAGVPIRATTVIRLAHMAHTEAPQGVVAIAASLPEADLDELALVADGRVPFLVVFDGVTDPHNLGAMLRSAEIAGATGAVLPRHRAAHITATVTKAAAGAVEHLPIALVGGVPSALARLAAAGVWTVGLDGAAAETLWGLSVATEPVAIVLGAEGDGLSRLVKARCQLLVSIPQVGAIASLNVSAAGALACFEVARRRAGKNVGVDRNGRSDD